jgi:non-ribosomal peptide synthetase component E (peptide arylation enzyme)
MGEKICAVVVARPGAEITLESICKHFQAAGLAMFKFPERMRIVTQLPRNSVGKVLRGELTRIAESAESA